MTGRAINGPPGSRLGHLGQQPNASFMIQQALSPAAACPVPVTKVIGLILPGRAGRQRSTHRASLIPRSECGIAFLAREKRRPQPQKCARPCNRSTACSKWMSAVRKAGGTGLREGARGIGLVHAGGLYPIIGVFVGPACHPSRLGDRADRNCSGLGRDYRGLLPSCTIHPHTRPRVGKPSTPRTRAAPPQIAL